MKRIIQGIASVLMGVSVQATLVDFNNAGDLTNNFTWATASQYEERDAGGVGDSRRIFVGTSFNVEATYDQGTVTFAEVGDSTSASIDFQWSSLVGSGDFKAVMLGFTDVSGGDRLNGAHSVGVRVVPGSTDLINLQIAVSSIWETDSDAITLTDGNWYRLSMIWTRISPTTSDPRFTVTAELFSLGADGTESAVSVASYEVNRNTTYLDGAVYQEFTAVNGYGGGAVSLDNFNTTIIPVSEPVTPYEAWTANFGLFGSDALMNADPDGDGYNNMLEYGLGGDPSTADDSINIPVGRVNGNLFELTHVALTNSDSGIDYIIETSSDLVSGMWTNVGITTARGSLSSDPSFDSVTNRISIEGVPSGFMRLRIVEQ